MELCLPVLAIYHLKLGKLRAGLYGDGEMLEMMLLLLVWRKKIREPKHQRSRERRMRGHRPRAIPRLNAFLSVL